MTSQGQGLGDGLRENCSMKFRQTLLTIDENLGAQDVEALKFLCRDCLSHKKLEQCQSAWEIFDQLLTEEQLTEEDPFLLAELLYISKQKSLLKHLGYTKEQMQRLLPAQRRISLFRNLLYELSEGIDSEHLKRMIFLQRDVLPKTEMTSLSFLAYLEKQDLICEDKLTMLEDLCKTVVPILMTKIKKYKTEKTSQVVIPPIDQETKSSPQEEEELVSQFNGLLKEPWKNEHVRSNEEPGSLLEHFESVQTSCNAKGDGPTNCALTPVSVEMLGASVNITNSQIIKKEAAVYRMDRKHRGYCVIVNNQHFISRADRKGTHKDAEHLWSVFQWLGFTVRMYHDVTKVHLEEVLEEYKSHPGHTDGDCFVFCVLTHGEFGGVYSSDEVLIPIRTIMSHFTAQQCPGLAHKPKLFFIQACQGEHTQPSVSIEADALNPEYTSPPIGEESLQNSIPIEADFLLGLATVPGYVSFRHVEKGSWYIQSLCNHLKDLVPRQEDILSILTAVNNDVSRHADKHGRKKQMPQPAFTLRKKLVFPVP
ncbi:caspase-10 [Choloepus didactylus]|uniref:caspase-10 n=1 Tax=Choloepus didactylus TaxID=27675 RepID=UPI00189CDE09|nr:caspase-10 [Choloepus didactylus]